MVPISKALVEFGCDRLAVARAREAVLLREHGITCPIHIVGSLQMEDVPDVVKAGAIPSITTVASAQRLAEAHPGAEVHVIIDSGMNRVGVQEEYLESFLESVSKLDIRITGFYTHMASADEPEEVGETQKMVLTFFFSIHSSSSLKVNSRNSVASRTSTKRIATFAMQRTRQQCCFRIFFTGTYRFHVQSAVCCGRPI